MNNLMVSFQKMLKNKNVVTVLGILLIIVILYFGYNYQIKKQVDPITGIPVAASTIQPRTEITDDMVDTISVAPIMLRGNVIRSREQVVGKYSNVNTMIPKGSMFFQDTVISKEDLPDYAITKTEKGQVPYNFPVSMDSTYGNSIYPDSYIDIYMKVVKDNGKIIVGKLLENVKVLAVKDSNGKNVFENTQESRTPAFLIFGVSNDVFLLLRKASYLDGYNAVLFPVPHGTSVEEETGATVVKSTVLKDFINSHSVPNDEIETTTKVPTTNTTTTTNNTTTTTNNSTTTNTTNSNNTTSTTQR